MSVCEMCCVREMSVCEMSCVRDEEEATEEEEKEEKEEEEAAGAELKAKTPHSDVGKKIRNLGFLQVKPFNFFTACWHLQIATLRANSLGVAKRNHEPQ